MDSLSSIPELSRLSDRDKMELQQFVNNEMQKSKIQATVHSLTDMCFKKCIGKISSGKLDRYEEPCLQNCVDRFMDANKVILKNLETMR